LLYTIFGRLRFDFCIMKTAAAQARIIQGKVRSRATSLSLSTTLSRRNASPLPTGSPAFGGVGETAIEPEFFRQFFESAPEAVLVVDRGGKILRMNKQSELMFGYRREVLLGKSMNV